MEPWTKLPVIVRAVAVGLIAAAAGTVVWARLISANIHHGSQLPWSVPIMAVYLVVYWRYFARGDWWPAATRVPRRQNARANTISDEAWGMSFVAGFLGLVSILLLQGVMSRLVTLPQQHDVDPSQFPLGTVTLWVIMSALVAGIVEETAFRGYIQRPIEQRYGPVVAILVTGSLFAFGHFSHPEVGIVLLPYYLAVAAVYGSLAYFTDSTLPSIVLHAGGNMFSAIDLFTRGRSEWQLSTTAPKLIWETGADAAFVGSVLALLVVSALTVAAFVALSRTSRARAPARAA